MLQRLLSFPTSPALFGASPRVRVSGDSVSRLSPAAPTQDFAFVPGPPVEQVHQHGPGAADVKDHIKGRCSTRL